MFTKSDFKDLAATQEDLCISLYSPTHRAGFYEEDRIRFKNVLKEARQELEKRGKTEKQAEELLKPAHDLLEQDDFWEHRSDGLAVFLTENDFHTYACPVNFEPFTYLHDHFYLRPTLPMFASDKKFYLLALSKNEVRLFEGERYAITPIKIKDKVPVNMQEVVGALVEEGSLQQHTVGETGQGTIFHGQGAGEDDTDGELRKYFSQIDKGINDILKPIKYPLVLAGVDENTSLYEKVSKHSKIWEQHVEGNVDEEKPAVLHEKAVAVLGDYFQKEQNNFFEQFSQYMADEKGSFSITNIIPAAKHGKIASLFTNKDEKTWGAYDAETATVTIHEERQADSVELLNIAATQTFLNNGTVFNVPREEMPQATANVNAILRY